MQETCPRCLSHNVKEIQKAFSTKWKGKVVVIPDVTRLHCTKCEEEFMTPGQAKLLSILVKTASS